MASNDHPTPLASHLPGGWIETPGELTELQLPHNQAHSQADETHNRDHSGATEGTFINNALHQSSASYYRGRGSGLFSASSHSTAVPSPDVVDNQILDPKSGVTTEAKKERRVEVVPALSHSDSSSGSELDEPSDEAATKPTARPQLQSRQSRPMTEDDLFRALSRRRTSVANGLSRKNTQATASSADDEQDEINRLSLIHI